ncbi:hypothetical protein ABH931_007375 [Streptacidiphilus sp. MAP12-33]|uniref:hypothetical protein n=1 Tax=Streptacidiphilus sp. MAP12-33 TaxID=3156266 RepID=UPI00351847B0
MDELTALRHQWVEQSREVGRLGRLCQELEGQPERQAAVAEQLDAALGALRPLTKRLLAAQRRKERSAAAVGAVLSVAGVAQFGMGLQDRDWILVCVGALLTAIALPTTLRLLVRRRRRTAQDTGRESPQAPSNSSW